MRDPYPLAYHITFGSYGTRFQGDERGTVDRSANEYGDPIIGADRDWQQTERGMLRFPPRVFELVERQLVEGLIPDICLRGGWQLHAYACGKDHVHTLMSAAAGGELLRQLLKLWLGQSLSGHIALEPEQTFWAESGSVKWVWAADYFARAKKFMHEQRATR